MCKAFIPCLPKQSRMCVCLGTRGGTGEKIVILESGFYVCRHLCCLHFSNFCDSLFLPIELLNPLLHRYSFQLINKRQLLKTLWEKKKLLVMSNFFFSHNVFYSIRNLYPHLSIFMTSYHYLLLNWKSPKLACEVKG